jgi:hypothetical protein
MTRQPYVRIQICSFRKQIQKIRWCLPVTIVHQRLSISGQMDLSLLYQELCMRRALEVSTWLFQICWTWYISTNSCRSIFLIQKIFCLMMCWLSYVGTPVVTHDVPAIRQDPNLFLLEADSKDPVVPVYHHCTPATGYLANRAT